MDNPAVALRKTSLVDYPGKISAVLFFQGCNLCCPWCHNPGLVRGQLEHGIPLDQALGFIEKRRKVLGAVVLSGGEPTLYKGLPDLIASIKKHHLLVKLDTNGTRPDVLEKLFQAPSTKPDYIALDLKVSPDRYGELAKNHSGLPEKKSGENLRTSGALISRYGINHEFRTLILPNQFITDDDIDALAQLVDDAPWIFRPFVPGNCLDESWNNFLKTDPDEQNSIIQKARSLGKNVIFYH